MNKQDLGMYLMIWLISSGLIWLTDVEGILSVKEKVLFPAGLTLFVILFRIAIYLMGGI